MLSIHTIQNTEHIKYTLKVRYVVFSGIWLRGPHLILAKVKRLSLESV